MLTVNIGQYAFVEPDHEVVQPRDLCGPRVTASRSLFMPVALLEEVHQAQVRRQVGFLNGQGFFIEFLQLGQVMRNSHSTFARELKAW